MSKYVDITPSSGATSATANVTIYTSSISGYGTLSGKIYICNKNAAIKDRANNSLAQSTLKSENMYFDRTWAYSNGTVVYFNPTIGSKCTDYTSSQSEETVKSGCMKWYAYNDSKNNDTVDLLLDHNLKTGIYASSIFSCSGCCRSEQLVNLDSITNQLRSFTSSWTGVETHPSTSVCTSAPMNGSCQSCAINYNNSKAKLPPSSISSYSFAYVNTADDGNIDRQSYFTSDFNDSRSVNVIGCVTSSQCSLGYSMCSGTKVPGGAIRPVITVKKSKL